jgi:cbb3-type cytochrome oxidase subunit 1
VSFISYHDEEDIEMAVQSAPSNGKAIASLVLGIVSIVFCVYGIGIVTGIIGLVLGISAKKENPSGMATAGIVLSIIGIVISGITLFACIACVSACTTLPWRTWYNLY